METPVKVECPAKAFGACSICRSMLLLSEGNKCPVQISAQMLKDNFADVLANLQTCPKVLPSQMRSAFIADLASTLD